jgi:hypothetical protein
MKSRFAQSVLRNGWTQITLQLGELKSADTNVRPIRKEQNDIMLIPCTFDKGKLHIQMAFNSEGKLSGMYTLP